MKLKLAVIFVFIVIAAVLFPKTPETKINTPKNVIVFYGNPLMINSSNGEIERAVVEFARYKHIIFKYMPVDEKSSQYKDYQSFITKIKKLKKNVYIVIDAGVVTGGLTVQNVEDIIKNCHKIGIEGVFYDNFGYGSGVDRARQNKLIGIARNNGCKICISAPKPADVFGAEKNTFNPKGAKIKLRQSDYFLIKDFVIVNGKYRKIKDLAVYMDELKQLNKSKKIGLMAVTSNDKENIYYKDKFHYAWYAALLYGIDAVGWGEYEFSAKRPWALFRIRPLDELGKKFRSEVKNEGMIIYRETDKGKAYIDGRSYQYGILTE